MIVIESGIALLRKPARLLAVALIVVCRPWIPAFAQPDGKHNDNAAAQAAVAHLESQWLNALNTANVEPIAAILADDFVRPAPDSGQFVNKADLLSYYRSHLKPISPDQRRIEDMTVTPYGTTAVARGWVIRSASDGHVISRLLFTDVFVQRNGKWQAVSAQENPVTTAQNSSH